MTVGSGLKTLAIALVVSMTAALPAMAQLTTGSIAGSVKDAQGGVIPGATVTLISETKATKSTPVVTSDTGTFVFANVSADTYTIQVEMPSFKTLKRSGVAVSPGTRADLGALTIEVGGATEVIDVKGEAPTIQATTGERSFTIPTDSVENLPIANRGFSALAALAPGVSGTSRIGGGGATNIMMDGISTMDTGNNGQLLQMSSESIAEVKVLTSSYQAEYGRSSGLQITAVTKSGTNRFRGSLYDVERNSDWNPNSRTNILNGDPKTASKQRDWGYSIGGPIGKPNGNNKLFFFYAQEYAPRTSGNNVVRFRVPTVLERQGDFSQSFDNNGNIFRYIYDSQSGQPIANCSTSATGVHTACFQDGGVLGKIPANRLYQTGLNLLSMYPTPNIDGTGLSYNLQITRPTEKALAWEPAIRVDYQPAQRLRATVKYSGFQQRNQVFNGTLPGFNDAQQYRPVVFSLATTVNYNLNATTFLEATYGASQNEFAGCIFGQGSTGPVFCTTGVPRNPVSNRNTAGVGALPMLFPDALKLDPRYYAYKVLTDMAPPFFQNGQILITPTSLSWGNRIANAPPNMTYPGFLNINSTKDVSISLTKVAGRHTFKSGFYSNHSHKNQNQNSGATFGALTFSNDTSNPIDSQFGFANAALGVFSSYNQLSSYIEGNYVYYNLEGYLQDNWKLNRKLTLDYGVRLVHQQPQYDSLGQASNFLPEKFDIAKSPTLYVAGCVGGANPCTGNNRQAKNPLTGQLLGVGSAIAIGTIVPNTGELLNGLFASGKGIVDTTYTYPNLGVAPRFGLAYDVTGKQSLVVRGGAGLFFDRPNGNDIYAQVTNPPAVQNVTVRYGQLQDLSSGLKTVGPSSLNVYQYDATIPSSTQWNAGVQMALPWATTVDVAYSGQHSWGTPQAVNINAVDFGTAFQPQYQDVTLAPSATPGATALVTDLLRPYRGYGAITRRMSTSWRTFHSIQLSLNRRFKNGVSFGFNDTISLSDKQNSNARLQHDPVTGQFSYRADQATADNLFQSDPQRHILKANFIWDLPDLKSARGPLLVIAKVINDWQLSGIWTAASPDTYTIGFSYQSGGSNINLTGSPDYGARIRVVGDPGAGCSSDVYRQFNTAAFQGPLVGSVGLESGNNYLKGCFSSALDLSIARNIKLPKGRNIQLRVDMFNAPNQARITGRNTTLNLANPNDPVTNTAPAFDPITGLLNNGVNLTSTGAVSVNRSLPKNAGFGVANAYQAPRSLQGQIRFSF